MKITNVEITPDYTEFDSYPVKITNENWVVKICFICNNSEKESILKEVHTWNSLEIFSKG